MASNCVDTALLELIVRNAVFKMLQDHTLQSGVKACDCNWIGHETKLVTCDALPGLAGDLVEDGLVSRVVDFTWDPVTHELTLETVSQSWTVNLSTILAEVAVSMEAMRDELEAADEALAIDLVAQIDAVQAQLDATRILTMAIEASGDLVLTKGDGSTLSVDLDSFVRDTVNDLFNELWPCGPLMQVAHDDSLLGAGTSCDPLRVSPAWFISQDSFLRVVNYDPATHTLTLEVGPDGGPYETFTVDLSTLLPIVVTGPVLTGNGTLNTPLGFDCEAAAACIEPFLSLNGDTDSLVPIDTTAASSTEAPELSTTVYGDRDFLLGGPDGWMNVGGKRVPYWN